MDIPFTTKEFFEVIQLYNVGLFPAQLIIFILGIIALVFVHRKSKSGSKFISVFLGVLWIWIGTAYHLAFFTSINNAAWGFGSLFILQGVLFLFEGLHKKRLDFAFKGKSWEYIGYFFIVFGLFLYPVIIYFFKGSIELTITLGLPCPSTILTFGFLMITTRSFPKYLLIVPTLWAIIGTGAALRFQVYPDYLMLLAAIVADFYLIRRRREKKTIAA